MKQERNEPCKCGSGLKYKKCCLNKKEEFDMKLQSLFDTVEKNKRKARISHCLHPESENCSGKIVRSHAIQNNRILNKLAVNGMLKTMDGESHMMFQDVDTKGRKQATTFKGFCSFHDKKTFQPIEDFEFNESAEQLFLYTYRALAWSFHKKLEQVNHIILNMESLKNKGFHFSDDLMLHNSMHLLGHFENESTLKRFNGYLQNENYERVSSYVWTIPYEIKFAVSTMLTIEHDIKGNMINNIKSFRPLKNIYLNIFPGNQESYLLWTWESNHEILEKFAKQFDSLKDKDKKNYLNNNLPRWTDAIVISPDLWDTWGAPIHESIIAHSNFEFLYRAMEEDLGTYAYEYEYTPWDFFE
ncbi:hypothetical protein B4134_0815 [Bacillus safensis]|uniref:SEC-C domain-containing protein n=1 Tax=Bacillus TaxID=1386 RepID=UPI00059793BD|nr:SEC-C domain-containing protein [Bacillus safensis]KIL23505.1 hypothetical protein B4134_0815 [Bacillus safensis]MDV3451781.1 SEC-C domain-containing protein [Bacillus safensis]